MCSHDRPIQIGAIIFVLLTVFACTSYKGGIAPLTPAHNTTAGSLQPEFKWEPSQETGVTYDFAIWESDKDPKAESSSGEEKIETVYYREGVKGTSHRIKGELNPNRIYYWAVRTRKGGKIAAWSTVQTQVFTGVSYHRRTRNFKFVSPDIPKTDNKALRVSPLELSAISAVSQLEPPTKEPNSKILSEGFGSYHAFIIGNNNYKHLKPLKAAVNDAEAVAKFLEKEYGFSVTKLIDADRYEIMAGLNGYRKKLTPGDNLLIYYAGHGWLDKDTGEGYWLPVDGEPDNPANWISNNSISNSMKAIPAKHIMVVADSCYSGTLTRGLNVKIRTQDYLQKIAQKRARTVLASGGLEPVMDSGGKLEHSVFATAFIDTLRQNEESVIDATKLFSSIRREVMLHADQTPEYSDIRKAGHEGGDFLFVKDVAK
jgi:uncharacterized caspase-like protein